MKALRTVQTALPLLIFLVLLAGCASIPGEPPYRVVGPQLRKAQPAQVVNQSATAFVQKTIDVLNLAAGAATPELRAGLESVRVAYHQLERSAMSHQELAETKFLLLNYHRVLFDSLVARCRSCPAGELTDWLDLFLLLDYHPGEATWASLAQVVGDSPAGAQRVAAVSSLRSVLERNGDARIVSSLLAKLGEKSAAGALPAGPAAYPDFIAGHMSGPKLGEWASRPDMAAYARLDGAVRYKGLEMRVGDIFLIQEHNDSESLFVAASDTKTYLYHVGTYVEPVIAGRKVPAIYEAYEAGVRLVPLNVWLGRDFLAYGEQYRLDPGLVHEGWQEELSAAALTMVGEPHGYDIMSPAVSLGGDRYANCVSASLYLFRRIGVKVPHLDSPISGIGGENLASLGTVLIPVPSPEGMAILPQFTMISTLDNDYAFLTMARDLVGDYFFDLLHTRKLVIKPEGNYGFYRWGLRLVAAKDPFWQPFLLGLFGFTLDTAPDGPPDLSALVLAVQDSINAAMPAVYRDLVTILADWDFSRTLSLAEIRQDRQVKAKLDKNLNELSTWFAPIVE